MIETKSVFQKLVVFETSNDERVNYLKELQEGRFDLTFLNEKKILGTIDLTAVGTEIRADYSGEHGFKRDLFIIPVYRDSTSTDIWLKIKEELLKLVNDFVNFPYAFIDLQVLDNVGEFINWKKLVEEANCFNEKK